MKNTKNGGDKLFAIACDDWKNEVLALAKGSSYKSYSYILRDLVLEFGHLKVNKITKDHIQRYIVKLSKELSVGNIRNHIGAIRSVAEYSDDDFEMPRRLKFPKKKRPRQEFYTFEEVRKLLQISDGQEKVLIMLLAETGCRIGEGLGLKTEDVGPDYISITKNVYEGYLQDTPKTDSSIRKVSISDKLRTALLSLIDEPRQFIFRTPTGRAAWPQQLTGKFKKLCEQVDLEWKGFHAFRRGNVTELLLNLQLPERIVGMRVGHLSSQNITLGVYCQTVIGSDKPWVEKIEESLYG